MSFLNLKRRLVCLFILLCLCGAPVLTDRVPAVTVTAQAASKYTGWKKKSGKYYFMGVYVLDNFEKNDDGNRAKIYRRISTVYPVGENEELARYIKAWEGEEELP